jgi:hypothetical protein
MAQNLREQIADSIIDSLKDQRDPQPVLVTREPFEVAELAITQFPAILITATLEERETITMGGIGVGRRQGIIEYTIRGFVRGTELDKKRNDLIERIEETLDSVRYRGIPGVTDSQLASITVIERLPPLAEFSLLFRVNYNYLRTQT